MKKLGLLIISLSVAIIGLTQTQVALNSTKTSAKITQNTDQKLVFTSSLQGFYITNAKTKDGMYSQIIIPEYYPDNNTGYPELPVMTKLIEVPYNAKFRINIISYDEQIIDLNEYGTDLPIIPNQESISKNQDPNTVPFRRNESIYTHKEYYETELVKVENISKMRGIQVAQLTVSPFSYDIESNVLTIKNNIIVEIEFKNADFTKTSQLKASKYSPAFDAAYHKLWNYKAPATKDALSQYPIKYVIVSDRMFEDALAPFIDWKTKKGFIVDVQYTDVLGSTTDATKTYIQDLYNNATTENPAPTYLLIVGDVAQVPTFSGSGHKTDMYYCEFDGGGDYIPEMYFGRLSATSVEQLAPQIEKTLMFEQYTFPDPSFLAEVVLVAGDDNTYGPTHANGQVNYAHNYYFNETHGVTDYTYLYPTAGSSEAEIISDISNGVGLVNYTAHCGSNGWAGPSFTTSDVPGLANNDEYFFSIGNCCLSNKFDDNECFGEALLRANNKGAVIHIGGSNSTYWNEDFYWSCGITNSISATTSYEQTTQAAYDHLFHENNEEPYVTAYQMAYLGNLTVSESTSSLKQYYWEIYHVMGDPSLMPYVGVPDEVEATYLSTLPIGMTSLTVTTEEMAYVAISIDGELLDAKLADASGIVTLEFEPIVNIGTADIVVTKQFRSPHIGETQIIPNENDFDAMLQIIHNPEAIIHYTEATIIPEFTIINLGILNLTDVTVGYIINDDDAVEQSWNGNLALFETDIVTFPEITLPAGQNTFTAYVSSPNGQIDEYPANDQMTKNVLVYYGNAKLTDALTPGTVLCNTNSFAPQVIIKNLDSFNLTSAIITYECGTVTDEVMWSGSLSQNATDTITFSETTFPAGNHTITYNIESINGGDNYATSGTTVSVDFMLVESGDLVTFDLLTDVYPEEISWMLFSNSTEQVIYSDGPYPESSSYENIHIINEFCLNPGCYTLVVYDSFGDGITGYTQYTDADNGFINLTNTTIEEEYYNFDAGNPTWDSVLLEFCIKSISCPSNLSIGINDSPIELIGGLPVNGTYTGNGITENTFDPALAGEGTHTITYHYTFEGSDELTCEFEITVSVNSISNVLNENIEIYPNPTTGILNFDFTDAQVRSIQILDLCGKVVGEFNSNSDQLKIDISELAKGSYFVKIKTETKTTIAKVNLTN